ncbi:MAG: hypothetical protein C5B51_20600 [Terriglobia bacterium]|nr:MAG: hypothetical protein C5B51_20600 [Terriglobia bacterium]
MLSDILRRANFAALAALWLGAGVLAAATPWGVACGDGRIDTILDDFDSPWTFCCKADPSIPNPILSTVPGCHGNAMAVTYDLTNPPQGQSWIVLQRFLASPRDLTGYTHIRLAMYGSNLNSHDSVQLKLYDGNQLYTVELPSITDLPVWRPIYIDFRQFAGSGTINLANIVRFEIGILRCVNCEVWNSPQVGGPPEQHMGTMYFDELAAVNLNPGAPNRFVENGFAAVTPNQTVLANAANGLKAQIAVSGAGASLIPAWFPEPSPNFNTYTEAETLLVLIYEYERTGNTAFRDAARNLAAKLLTLQIPPGKNQAGAWFTGYGIQNGILAPPYRAIPTTQQCDGNETMVTDPNTGQPTAANLDACEWVGNVGWTLIALGRLKRSGFYDNPAALQSAIDAGSAWIAGQSQYRNQGYPNLISLGTEGNISAYFGLVAAGKASQAAALANAIFQFTWDSNQRRFKAGVSDATTALDVTGSWGVTFLRSIGRFQEALDSQGFAASIMGTSSFDGSISGYGDIAGPYTVAIEFTGQAAAAGIKDAGFVIPQILTRQQGPGSPYPGTFPGATDHWYGGPLSPWDTTMPGVSPTAWVYFAVSRDPLLDLLPAVISTVPASGSGSAQLFAVMVSDPNGTAISSVAFLVNAGLSGANGCWILFTPAANTIQLANDPAGGFSAPVTLGSASFLSNSQCTVSAATASVATSGNSLTLYIPVSFAFSFSGTKSTFAIVSAADGTTSGWQTTGSWTVPASGAPAVISTIPASGLGSSQTFSVTAADGGGAANINFISLLVNNGINGAHACWVLFNRGANTLQLANDAGTGFSAPVTLGTAGPLSNSQCTLNTASASASAAGTALTVNLPLSFSFAFAGAKGLFVLALDNSSQSSGWQNTASWTIPVSGPPTVVSVVPASGTGSSQTFAITVADGSGAAAIGVVSILVNTGISGASACWVLFNPGANTLQLANDAGTGFSAPVTAGTVSSLSNSQCTLSAAIASSSASGTNLTVNLPLSFAFGFSGTKNIFVWVLDNISQNSGWQASASWTVPSSGPPSVIGTIVSGSGSSQRFSVIVADGAGFSSINFVSFLINSGLNGANACWLLFNNAPNTLQLANDPGTGFSAPIALGKGGSLSNSQCTSSADSAYVSTAGTNLTVSLPLTFVFAWGGVKNLFVLATANDGKTSGWQNTGSWTAPSSGPPSVASTFPASGSGTLQTFSVTAGDGSGPSAVAWISFLVNTGINGANACWVLFNRGANTLQLANDAGTGFSAPVTIGTAASVSNSQCSVNAASASTSTAGYTLAVKLPLSFAFAFSGNKSSFAIVYDNGNQNSGWQNTGSWAIPGSGPPAVLSATPSAGSGNSQTFVVTAADGGGPSVIGYVGLLINSGLTGVNGCWVLYNRSANTLQLANDAGTGFSSPVAIGAAGPISNSQCSVNTATASTNSSGTTLTVSLPLSFTVSFIGLKSVFAIAQDNSNQNSGWVTTGTWNVASTAPLLPTPPPSATYFANLDNDPISATPDTPAAYTWGQCVTGCGNPPLTKSITHTGVSEDSNALDSYNSGNPYWGVLIYHKNGAWNYATNYLVQWHFMLDTNASNVQAVEFDFPVSIGGVWFYFGSQCDVQGSHTWDYWNQAQQAWVHTAIPCNGFSANTWHTIRWYGTRTSTQLHYMALEVDGVQYNIDVVLNAPPTSWTDDFIVQFQSDGNFAGTGYNMYADNLQAWIW